MRSFLLAIALLAPAAACSKSESSSAAKTAELPTVEVSELDAKIAAGESQAVDANGTGTRKKLGVVPGAILLSDSDTYLPSKELPADKSKSLVFYCANEHCEASHDAAKKARIAGYSNVKVLPAGIAGWVAAGKTTQKI